MVGFIYRKCFAVLGKKPIRLWGLSMLAMLLCYLATVFGVLPIISIPITLTINAGMSLVYLDGYRGKEVDSNQIFKGFKDFARVAGGMAWMMLWVLIWSLIPIAGIVLGIIKSYSYRFVPYILMTEPEISATDALKESMKRTQGLRGKMFLADLFVMLVSYSGMLLFGALSSIRYVGGVFAILYFAILLAVVAFVPLLLGLISAAFYEERKNIPQPVAYGMPVHCAKCGAVIEAGAVFCAVCGTQTPQIVYQQHYPNAVAPYQGYPGTAPQAPYQTPAAPQPPSGNNPNGTTTQ